MAKTNNESDTSKADEVPEYIKLLKEKHQPKLLSLEELQKLVEGGEEAMEAYAMKQIRESNFFDVFKEDN